MPSFPGIGFSEEIQKIEKRLEALREREHKPTGNAWRSVELARHPSRPQTLDYIAHALPDFLELRGDRLTGEDPAIVGGMATLDGRTVMVVGHHKGHNLKERQRHNFGMARPEGYRKAQRLALLAEKFNMPLLTLVDTPGAFPGVDAEEKGQAGAIARSLQVLARLSVPTVAVVIGEGGSGGALALALCDRVFMLEHAVYSVIMPEGCAAILWRDASEATRAAEELRMTARDLLELGVIDEVILEPGRGAHRHPGATIKRVFERVETAFRELELVSPTKRVEERRRKYLAMGRVGRLGRALY